MKNILSFIILILFTIMLNLDAAAQHDCGSDLLHQFKMNSDSSYAKAFIKHQKEIAVLQLSGLHRGGGVTTIPVVVHVIHLGEAEGVGSNISDTQILFAIQGANDRFANITGMGTDTELQFCLASRDPFGCPSTGIVRVDGTVLPNYATSGVDYPDDVDCGAAPDVDVKALSTWPVLDYYNIWVVSAICEGWAGYAYYPNGEDYDGTIIRYEYMTYGGTTITHELGHAFYLAHTFNGDNGNVDCPLNDDCLLDGDYVCDTPPHKQSDCGETNPCTIEGVWDNSRYNFMSYCGSTNRFTAGQGERMQTTLLTFPRMSLVTSLGCTPSDFGTIVSAGEVLCFGECSGTLSAAPQCTGTYTYEWSNGESTPSISGLCPGTYSVTVTNEDAISATFEMELVEPALFEISADTLYTICSGDQVQFEASEAEYYDWSPSEGLSDTTISNPVAQPDFSSTYLLVATSSDGCIDSIEVDVVVNENPVTSIVLLNDTLFAQPPGLSYQWYNDGNLIEGATGEFFDAPADGDYTVVVTDGNDCTSESETFNYVGINEFLPGNDLLLFPNPNHGTFTLFIPSVINETLIFEVYDNTGRKVFSESKFISLGESGAAFQFNHFAEGIYSLIAASEYRNWNQKFSVVN